MCLPCVAAYSSRVAVVGQGVNVVIVSVCVDHSNSVVSSLVAMVTSKRTFISVRFSVTSFERFLALKLNLNTSSSTTDISGLRISCHVL